MSDALRRLYQSMQDLNGQEADLRAQNEELADFPDLPAYDDGEAMRRVAAAKARDTANGTNTAEREIEAMREARAAHAAAREARTVQMRTIAKVEADLAGVRAQRDEVSRLYEVELKRACGERSRSLRAKYEQAVAGLADVAVELMAIAHVSGYGYSDLNKIKSTVQLPRLGASVPEGMREHLGTMHMADVDSAVVYARAAAIRADLLGG